MLEVALDRLLGVVARMEGMTVRHVRVVRSLLVRTGLMVFRRFLVMSRGVLVVFSRLLMMFSRLFGHGIPPVSGELPSDQIGKPAHIVPGSGAIGPWSCAQRRSRPWRPCSAGTPTGASTFANLGVRRLCLGILNPMGGYL